MSHTTEHIIKNQDTIRPQMESSETRTAKAIFDMVQNPQNYCYKCSKKIGVCKHTKIPKRFR